MSYFTRNEHALDYMYDLLTRHAGPLGINYVAYGDEKFLPEYPVVVLAMGPLRREVKGPGQFMLTFTGDVWIYHAGLSDSHQKRNKDDMALAAAVTEVIHADYKFGGGLIFGHVSDEQPGVLGNSKGAMIIGSRLIWTGQCTVPMRAVGGI